MTKIMDSKWLGLISRIVSCLTPLFPDTPKKQSKRFIGTAKMLGADEGGQAFERVLSSITATKDENKKAAPKK